MSTQDPVWNNLLAGTPWGDLTIELPPYDFQQQVCWDLLQSWGDLEDSIPVIDPPLVENWMPGLVEIQELEDEYEHMPSLTSAEEAWSEYIPVEEFSAAVSPAAEPLEVAPEEDLIDPIPIVETVADISTASHREENP
jgi:hypothetical protein